MQLSIRIIVGASIAAVLLPLLAFAQIDIAQTDDVQSQVQALLTQVQQQISMLTASNTLPMLPDSESAQVADLQNQAQAILTQIQTLQQQQKPQQQQLPTPVAASSVENVDSQTNTSRSSEGEDVPPPMPPAQFGKQTCLRLSRNLSIGAQGDDVRSLQELLAQDPDSGFNGPVTGFFGPLTAKAVGYFQIKNGISASGTGMVGLLTRNFLEWRCGN